MHRLEKHNIIANANLSSKSFLFKNCAASIRLLQLVAGLYKASSITLEHSLIFTALVKQLAVSKLQQHGKKKKRTVALYTQLTNEKNIWVTLDKLINELLPKFIDFSLLRLRTPTNLTYTIRLKQKFSPLVDFNELVSAEMYDNHKGIFLPLTIHLSLLSGVKYHQISEHYLRIMRLPLLFHDKRPIRTTA